MTKTKYQDSIDLDSVQVSSTARLQGMIESHKLIGHKQIAFRNVI